MAEMGEAGDAEHMNNVPISFSNPNYQLDDQLNSNTLDAENCNYSGDNDSVENYDDDNIYEDLDSGTFIRNTEAKGRKGYNRIDLPSMGLDLNSDPTCNLPSTPQLSSPEGSSLSERLEPTTESCDGRHHGNYNSTSNSQNFPHSRGISNNLNHNHLNKNFTGTIQDVNSPDSNDSGIQADSAVQRGVQADSQQLPAQRGLHGTSTSLPYNSHNHSLESQEDVEHIHGPRNDDIYAVIAKKSPNKEDVRANSPKEQDTAITDDSTDKLPHGWQKHEDEDGPYYWHIKSGTIQRELPTADTIDSHRRESRRTLSGDTSSVTSSSSNYDTSSSIFTDNPDLPVFESQASVSKATEEKHEEESKPIRFCVRSLGWVEIDEEDLTPERSSKAVNKCIVDLSLGRHDILDVVGRWGDGKDLFMDLDDRCLKLIDPQDLSVLNNQAIHSIRVWGVGRDNGRDFAYVARDKVTRKHMCHVFRCDTPARTIANTLRDICKKIMIERSLAHNLAQPVCTSTSSRAGLARPTNLPTQNRRGARKANAPLHSFPTPMEEPKKILKAHYLGATQVNKPCGIDIINAAIERMIQMCPREIWTPVQIAVAPSVITISEEESQKVIHESRVRYLSFLGIGKNVEYCSYIMHTAQDLFMAHIFHSEPSSGAVAKTIEAACKLRYQKCLDAHARNQEQKTPDQSTKSIGSAIKGMFGSLTGRRKPSG